jgi:hypothetical protein
VIGEVDSCLRQARCPVVHRWMNRRGRRFYRIPALRMPPRTRPLRRESPPVPRGLAILTRQLYLSTREHAGDILGHLADKTLVGLDALTDGSSSPPATLPSIGFGA